MRINCIEAIPVAYPEPNDCNAERHLCLGIQVLEEVVNHYRLDKQA